MRDRWHAADLLIADLTVTLDEVRDLVDSGLCHPVCLFGLDDEDCQCRCEGKYHGHARRD